MDSYIIYLILFSIILISGQLFQHSTIPLALILVITGMHALAPQIGWPVAFLLGAIMG